MKQIKIKIRIHKDELFTNIRTGQIQLALPMLKLKSKLKTTKKIIPRIVELSFPSGFVERD